MQHETRTSIRTNRFRGLLWGAPVALAALVTLFVPGLAWMHAPGRANIGHEALACVDCHQPAEGTLRQQLQAKVRYLIGIRHSDVAIGHEPVGVTDCVSCHERKSDAHPIDRFSEPRFEKILPELQVNQCFGCHREHTGRRVTMGATECRLCHEELSLKNDPLDVPHVSLVKDSNWSSCMGCHDFHGNHVRQTQRRLANAILIKSIDDYLVGIGKSPYGNERRFRASKERPEVRP